MRVLFVTFPWKTHLYNFVPLAWALQTAGHEVRVASEPPLADAITRAGLTAVTVGSPLTPQERGRTAEEGTVPAKQGPPGPVDSLFEIGAGRRKIGWPELRWLDENVVVPRLQFINDTMVDDLVTHCRSWQPDLVLWDAVSNAGAIAAKATGAAHGRVLFSLDVSGRLRNDFLAAQEQQPVEDRTDGCRDWYAAWAEKYGCTYSEDLVNGQFTVDQLPESLRLEPDDLSVSVRYVPYNGPAVVPDWVADPPTAPRVLMTFGITARELPEDHAITVDQVQDVLDAVADLDIELVLTLSDELRDELDRIPDNTRVVEFVPMQAIVSSCAVLVNHGGPGSFNSGLLNAIPQLLICSTPDAVAKNTLIEEHRIGIPIRPGDVDGQRVREALVQLLEDPSYREGAERMRRQMMAQRTPNDLVPELERLTALHRTADGA
ncbi:activator-dependent family glycosyltransferase [Streptomyces sp. NPDC047315]|uniref:activator-dependent family glycosyltransferase n=1 Tax=Streptomyces sp. NPDC047315 TaxID=3155142 RepID=UPI0033CE378C